MTREEEIRKRLEGATPGEWSVETREWIDGGVRLKSRWFVGTHHDYNYPDDTPEGALANADFALSVNAPADLRYLLEKVERLEAENAELRDPFNALEAAFMAVTPEQIEEADPAKQFVKMATQRVAELKAAKEPA